MSGRPPLIGLTTSEVRTRRTLRPIPHGGPTSAELALGLTYVRAIEVAGGLPVIVPPLAELDFESLLDSLDGVCLPGGPDLDPSTYGADEHPELGPFDPDGNPPESNAPELSTDNPARAFTRGSLSDF